MRVIERKVRLDGTHVDFLCERLLLEPGKRAVLRYEVDQDRRIAGAELTVPKGAVTIAHYWIDRAYNVYHWWSGGKTLGYYCNVAEDTSLEAALVRYTDLVVDVLIDPRGSALVLDEDDLPDDLAPPRRAIVARAVEELTAQSRRIAAEIERASRPFLPSG